jgi:hypothetical protein
MASGWPAAGVGGAVPPAEYLSADAQPKGGNRAPCTGSKERDSLHQVGDENYHRIRDACNQLKKRNSSYAMFHSPKEP